MPSGRNNPNRSTRAAAVEVSDQAKQALLELLAHEQRRCLVEAGGLSLGDVEVGRDVIQSLKEAGRRRVLEGCGASQRDVHDDDAVPVAVAQLKVAFRFEPRDLLAQL